MGWDGSVCGAPRVQGWGWEGSRQPTQQGLMCAGLSHTPPSGKSARLCLYQ